MAQAAPVLVIFDIDGTILKNGSVIRELFLETFTSVSGRTVHPERLQFMGMTDRGIIRKLMEIAGLNTADETLFEDVFTRFSDMFIRRLREIYPVSSSPYLLPGMVPLIQSIDKKEGMFLALGTGNIRDSAYIKLGRFELDSYFPVGGFGGDFELREMVIKESLKCARQHYGINFSNPNIWVIGDTMADVRAAHSAGVNAMAVCTGFETEKNLMESDAEVILEDLSDTALVLKLLNNHVVQ